jgi:ketosteroid isomerase-like protein
MTRDEAEAFAVRWAGWWNAGEVEKVLDRFQDDIVFTSPTAHDVVGTGTVRGKDALRAYWLAALERVGALRFTIDRILWDPVGREMAIVYTSEAAGTVKRVSENLRFGDDDRVVAAEVFHGVSARLDRS